MDLNTAFKPQDKIRTKQGGERGEIIAVNLVPPSTRGLEEVPESPAEQILYETDFGGEKRDCTAEQMERV